MDQNNSNQDQSQQTTPPPSDTAGDTINAQDVTQNQPAVDTQDNTTTQDQQSNPSVSTEPQSEQTDISSQQTSDPTQPPQQADQASQNDAASAQPAGNYIEDVGEDLIDLLDEIEANDNLLEVVANEMQLDKERVKTTLSGLLDKVDQGQVTAEELALIMAAPVVDEVPAEQTPTNQAPESQTQEPQQ